MDDNYVTQATVSVSDEGLLLMNNSGLGSCKFRGESYVCQALVVNHPSHHTIEGVQADAEVIGIYRKPTGEMMCMSTLVRINPAQTPSYTFFKQFVPYGLTTGDTQVTLQNWSMSMMLPPAGSYYTYAGSTVIPPCTSCEWVVFKSMINMDTTDFAYLVRNVQAGSRSVQALGNREVFFNDIENVSGTPMPHDNKFYLRLRPVGGSGKKKEKPKHVDLKNLKPDDKEDPDHPHTLTGHGKKALADTVSSNGGILGTFMILLVFSLVAAGLYYGNSSSTDSPFKAQFMVGYAIWTREMAAWIWQYILGFGGWLWRGIVAIVIFLYNWTIGWLPWVFTKLLPRNTPPPKIPDPIPT